HPKRTPLRQRHRGAQKGRRRNSADRCAGRRNSALLTRREQQSKEYFVPGTRRPDDGHEDFASGSAYQPDSRRRAFDHIKTGWNDPDARSVALSADQKSEMPDMQFEFLT